MPSYHFWLPVEIKPHLKRAALKDNRRYTAGDVPPFDYEDKGNLTGLRYRSSKGRMKNSTTTRFNSEELPGKVSSQDLILVISGCSHNLSYTKNAEKYLYPLPISEQPPVLVSKQEKSSDFTVTKSSRQNNPRGYRNFNLAQFLINWNQNTLTILLLSFFWRGISVKLNAADLSNGEFDFLGF